MDLQVLRLNCGANENLEISYSRLGNGNGRVHALHQVLILQTVVAAMLSLRNGTLNDQMHELGQMIGEMMVYNLNG